jgi:uncharacterized protein YbjT (DUF2867 family)
MALAARLHGAGHAVRGTTRDPARLPELEAAGVEPCVADPDRIATLVPALSQVTVICVLLGSAAGQPEDIAALHGTRLEMLLAKLLDSPVRGLVYETSGTAPPGVLQEGERLVRSVCERSHMPYALLDADPTHTEAWAVLALAAVESVLSR